MGDSEERDMKPAASYGIFAIQFVDEQRDVSLSAMPPKLTLTKLQTILDRSEALVTKPTS